MFDVVDDLNERLAASDFWLHAARVFEDVLNRQVGDPLQEALNANLSQRYMRGDIVDPRTFPLIAPVTAGDGFSYAQLVERRVREATVSVVFTVPLDTVGLPDGCNAIMYLEIDGIMYSTPIDRYTSRPLLIQEARYHGLDYFSDTISTEDYARMVDTVGQYMRESGSSKAFGRYLGYIKDVRLLINALWTTEDSSEFFEVLKPQDFSTTPVWSGGDWYPTSHVELMYDVLRDANLDDLTSLFYLLAPINLVLHRMVPTIFADARLSMVAASMPTIMERGNADLASLWA